MKTKILVISALLAATPASADQMIATLGQPLHEVSHSVRLNVEGGIATYTVQRTFANSGEIPDEAVLLLELPDFATATKLRIRSGTRWYNGELLEATEAAARYEELTGIGLNRLQDPALLSWVNAQNLELRVFPVPVGGTATLEYTLTAPVLWSDGRWRATYPRVQEGEGNFAPIVFSLAPSQEHQHVWIDQRRVSFDSPVVLGPTVDENDTSEIVIAPANDVIRARLGSTHLAYAHDVYTYFQIEVPQKLSATPSHAHVVFVVDRSRSLNNSDLDTQLDLIRGFADHLPGGLFQIVLVDRFAQPLLNEFTSLSEFKEIVHLTKAHRLELKNGSNIDSGLAMARELLSNVEGTRYIIAFTDDHLRNTLEIGSLAERSEITTHIVVLGSSWHRDDDHRLAGIAEAGGGILVHASPDVDLQRYAEHLVRPIMLENVVVNGLGDDVDILNEGETFEHWVRNDRRPERNFGTIRAKLWQKDVRVTPIRTREYDRATAGWVFTRETYWELDDELQMKLAIYANAVTPLTSFLAIEPGVRPSTEGLPWGEFGVGGMGMSGIGAGGYGTARGSLKTPDAGSIFDAIASECSARHPDLQSVVLVHTTREEIVDVIERSQPNPFGTCLVEGIWEVELPPMFREFAYSTQTVNF